MRNSVTALFQSRKFMTLLLSTVVSLVLLVIGEAAPQYEETAKTVVEIIMPLALAVIVGITVEDTALKLYQGRNL